MESGGNVDYERPGRPCDLSAHVEVSYQACRGLQMRDERGPEKALRLGYVLDHRFGSPCRTTEEVDERQSPRTIDRRRGILPLLERSIELAERRAPLARHALYFGGVDGEPGRPWLADDSVTTGLDREDVIRHEFGSEAEEVRSR